MTRCSALPTAHGGLPTPARNFTRAERPQTQRLCSPRPLQLPRPPGASTRRMGPRNADFEQWLDLAPRAGFLVTAQREESRGKVRRESEAAYLYSSNALRSLHGRRDHRRASARGERGPCRKTGMVVEGGPGQRGPPAVSAARHEGDICGVGPTSQSHSVLEFSTGPRGRLPPGGLKYGSRPR